MASTVAGAFAEFERLIQPTSTQLKDIKTRIGIAHGYVANTFTSATNMPLLDARLIGSGALGALVRPVDDVDLMAIFDDSYNVYENNYQNNSQAFIRRVRGAFNGCRIETVGVRGQAVRLFYKSGSHVDIAPMFRWDEGGFILPAGNGSWIHTDPEAQIAWFANRDTLLNSQLMPLIRLLKRWNNEHSHQLRSFHLSVMIASMFDSMNTDRPDAVAKFFDWAPNWLNAHDPAGYSGALSSYLTPLGKLSLTMRLANAAARAKDAIAAELRGDTYEAMRLWRLEFGPEFPAYGRPTESEPTRAHGNGL